MAYRGSYLYIDERERPNLTSIFKLFSPVLPDRRAGTLVLPDWRAGNGIVELTAAARLAEDRYTAGLGDYLDILESQRQAFVAESALLAAAGNG